jgi:hypothetical protein
MPAVEGRSVEVAEPVVGRHGGWSRSAGSTPLSVRIESVSGESC